MTILLKEIVKIQIQNHMIKTLICIIPNSQCNLILNNKYVRRGI